MQMLAEIALYAWFPIVIMLFHDMGGYRAMATAYVSGWLFLPTLEIRIASLPDYTKVSATSLAIGLASLMFDAQLWRAFRPRWWDLPILVVCGCPVLSSLYNGLGLWDGISMALASTLTWGLPYLLGRLYFDSFDKLRTLARAIFLGGVVYIPFCLIEMRMSPQFSNWVYGIPQAVNQSMRYGGWRPAVFMSNGLELGMWMTAACLMGFLLWYSRQMRWISGISEAALLAALMVVTVLCRSTGALVLMLAGIASLVAVRRFNFRWIPLALAAVPVAYIVSRAIIQDDGSYIVAFADSVFGADRAQSIEFRFFNENLLAARAKESLLFGWGGWGRNLIRNEMGEVMTIIDGLWIVQFGQFGLVGLLSFYLMLMAAPLAACFRFGRAQRWNFEDVAPLLGLSLFLLLYAIDTLLNGMENAVYPVALGGITSLLAQDDWTLREISDGEVEWMESPPAVARRLWPPPRQTQVMEEMPV